MVRLPMNKARRSTAYAIVVATVMILSMVFGCYTVYANHSTVSSLKSELSKKDQIINQQDNLIQQKEAIIDVTQDQVEQKAQEIEEKTKEVEEKAKLLEEKSKQVKDLEKKVSLKLEADELKVQPLVKHIQPEQDKISSNASFQGGWIITYYSLNVESTGKRPGDKGYGYTKSGRYVQDGVTVAVDPRVIPLGTWLQIELPDGTILTRRADDTGGGVKGKHIDLYVKSTSEARLMKLGKGPIKVRILKGDPRV